MADHQSALIDRINQLRRTRNAIILAHNYVFGPVQDIADFVGDSLELSIKANNVREAVIVFCGVRFMAETAKILSPDKTVLLPVDGAGCPMADMVTAAALRNFKKRYPGAVTVCYVNSTAAVKAEVDICCTSANAEQIVRAIPRDRKIIFLPDRNLGANVANATGRKLILWEGHCPIHLRFTPEMIKRRRAEFAHAALIVHPECPPEVVALADVALSTGGMLKFARETEYREIIVGTELGIIYRLQQENPGKTFIPLSEQAICTNMKKTLLEDVLTSLETMRHQIELNSEIIARAAVPIRRMISGKPEL
ncbi:MAG: quinolinate synthase NadA [Victivallaceae bacterium]|nr:quinolinate synthase NadA [Victivallaceae bacterium]